MVFSGFSKKQKSEVLSVTLNAAKQYTIQYPCRTTQRGLLKPGRFVISSRFPLGIFNAWAYFQPEEICVVYPNPQGQKQFPLNEQEDEEADFGEKSGTDDFAGFRKYRAGDAINSIAWKAYAREQGLLVKQFSGDGVEVLILSWEAVAHLNDIESRLSQLCYWIILADQSGLQYGLEIPNIKIEPAYGSQHKEFCLEQLARYGNIDKAK